MLELVDYQSRFEPMCFHLQNQLSEIIKLNFTKFKKMRELKILKIKQILSKSANEWQKLEEVFK